MSRIDELLEALASTDGGSRSALAEAVGVDSTDMTFRRALERAVAERLFTVSGSTRDRVYTKPPGLLDRLRALVADGPILAREFSDRAHEFGLSGKSLGAAKFAAGVETYRDGERFYCRVPASAQIIEFGLRGVGDCPERPGGLGHVWKPMGDDDRRACRFCGESGRQARDGEHRPVGEPGYFERATMERMELFSRLKAPASAHGKK